MRTLFLANVAYCALLGPATNKLFVGGGVYRFNSSCFERVPVEARPFPSFTLRRKVMALFVGGTAGGEFAEDATEDAAGDATGDAAAGNAADGLRALFSGTGGFDDAAPIYRMCRVISMFRLAFIEFIEFIEFIQIIGYNGTGAQLAVDIANELATGNATANPAAGRDLRYKIGRILDVLLQVGNERRELRRKEALRNGSAGTIRATKLGVDQTALYIRVATSVPHVGKRRERTALYVKRAALTSLERRVRTQSTVVVDGLVVESVPLLAEQSRIGILNGDGRGLLRNEVGRLVDTGTELVLKLLGDLAGVVQGASKGIDREFARFEVAAGERSSRHSSTYAFYKN